MSIEGVDLSFARPGGAALVKAGKRFVMRYLEYSHASAGSSGKFLTASEVADYRGHGLALCALFESTSTRALDGHAAGVADGNDARVHMDELGFPSSCPVYFAVDFNAQAKQQSVIDAYLGGAGSVLGKARIGVYGSYALCTRSRASGSAVWFYSTYAWSSGHIPSFGHVHQYLNGQSVGGGAVDLDRALQTNYGQWEPPSGAGPAQPIPEPVDMAYDFTQDTTKPVGSCTVKTDNPNYSYVTLATGVTTRAPGVHYSRAVPGKLNPPIPGGSGDRAAAYLVGPASLLTAVLASDVVFTPNPTADCTAEVAAATAPLEKKIKEAQEALA